ncbi:oligosaccharyl transferase subunit ost3/OST6 [Exophiala dermatitidis]|uniref:Dolichyl-diphosphooligosaccharide-protein glycosyltransferase n=2 Tax=Exophiala dermatitidis TaxID=5970 RepID=H6CAH1_EXODN|nr:dolichyl-diphosphooligosaccharide-protein glycosyltransferase [Exophiala dermatitidis NIH/UT8656]KAJ4503590.1 oligosaccharyl transferase subunit ost3/OST6 [Exophiala dermatitidis]EHY60135.1 dolichyl-diphosphooligosaccharide-protein glycosyltransferase [Exophiala dermatitidis NIH/UT8656]KAJ4504597.1 oligosaccharyl transferase subunit ost3/OST6 [Exophiala dermatitidis]KAJ4505319.1 oligosaccharyl transferase subunit ost3/OST6 [Exophiala dermatitidis]KAJ4530696.1 oligosaccharyl transferase subu
MRVFKLLALAALSWTALAAKKPATTSKYDTYSAKQASSAPIELDEKGYNELTAAPRDYSLAVLLTARDARYACGLCKEFDPEWSILGRSWQKGDRHGEHRLLLTTVDFDHGRNVFMKLQLQTAPVLLYFPPTVGPNAKPDGQPARLDFLGPQTADSVRNWLLRQLPPGDYPAISRPINYARIGATITILLGVFTFMTVAYPYVLPIIQNRNLWAGISLILILLFTSGHMFNHIRRVPYVAGNGRGGITYFAPGFQNQYGMETQIVAAMYALLAFATINLAIRVPRIKDPRTQQLAVIIWATVLFGMYSFLMSVFRIKNGGYPFWLPPF